MATIIYDIISITPYTGAFEKFKGGIYWKIDPECVPNEDEFPPDTGYMRMPDGTIYLVEFDSYYDDENSFEEDDDCFTFTKVEDECYFNEEAKLITHIYP